MTCHATSLAKSTHTDDNVPHQRGTTTRTTGSCHVNNDPRRQRGTTTTGHVDGDRAQRRWEPARDAFASRAFGKFFYIHFLLCILVLIIHFDLLVLWMEMEGWQNREMTTGGKWRLETRHDASRASGTASYLNIK